MAAGSRGNGPNFHWLRKSCDISPCDLSTDRNTEKYGRPMKSAIFIDKSVISSIPTYFQNKDTPIICYKYNKPIRSTAFNYNKFVTELDIENSIPDP